MKQTKLNLPYSMPEQPEREIERPEAAVNANASQPGGNATSPQPVPEKCRFCIRSWCWVTKNEFMRVLCRGPF